ncbi:hypothetical protein [Nocardia tengchongensis]|uniref:hypothetical protein n=1 Tax=Nocardia tengchongensis TaxID=2055889 RepID=UPI0036CB809E
MIAEELKAERSHVFSKPMNAPHGMLLGRFNVNVDGDADDYARRLRAVMHAALDIAADPEFDNMEELPTRDIPGWFVGVTGGAGSPMDLATRGVRQYTKDRDEPAWNLQEWLFTFDPQNRSWFWWDITYLGGGVVNIWVDTHSEPIVGNEQLYWLAYACGASSVGHMTLESAEVCESEPSIGI